jgi:predicted amidohydrolase
VASIFKERGVNVAVFPEFSLSGYFWPDQEACRSYMDSAVTEKHVDWIENSLKPLLDDEFRAIILNNLMRGPDGKYFNSTFPVAKDYDYLAPGHSYQKIFLPGIEKTYTATGQDDRLVLDAVDGGRFGFTTCYDYLFNDLLREYAITDGVDGIIQLASWRSAAVRDYPTMNIRTDSYYGDLWDSVMASASATNQVWTIACNAVGRHGVTNARFWGGSGVWAPSGLKLVQASHLDEELLIVHNLDIMAARKSELDDFDYAMDFREIYRPLEGSRGFTRMLK